MLELAVGQLADYDGIFIREVCDLPCPDCRGQGSASPHVLVQQDVECGVVRVNRAPPLMVALDAHGLEIADVILAPICTGHNVILGHQDLMSVLVKSVQVQVRCLIIAVRDLLDGKELALNAAADAGDTMLFEAL
jgi:hypothetical protein